MGDECIYQTAPQDEELDARSVFKRNKSDLKIDISFSYTGYLANDKEPSLPYNLPIDGVKTDGFMH